jgi:hypothetical protein
MKPDSICFVSCRGLRDVRIAQTYRPGHLQSRRFSFVVAVHLAGRYRDRSGSTCLPKISSRSWLTPSFRARLRIPNEWRRWRDSKVHFAISILCPWCKKPLTVCVHRCQPPTADEFVHIRCPWDNAQINLPAQHFKLVELCQCANQLSHAPSKKQAWWQGIFAILRLRK